ncbi:hypothetical protein [Lapillicoccus sp.]|uniref:hypothetical protein n=1 Tax=Lapillicoccus sp. TaxID=1909287 RepID=UPI0025F65443|nr:hypothetical protein [Lapillicoccus sp.]
MAQILPYRKPIDFGGTDKKIDMFIIDEQDLPSRITYRPGGADGHGYLEPSRPMTFEEYQRLVQSTRGAWIKVIPNDNP